MSIVIRQLELHEWPRYKALRLEALQNNPAAFGSSYAEAAARFDTEWKQAIRNSGHPDHLHVILFAEQGSELVGMAGAYFKENRWRIWGVYVNPTKRNAGIAMKLMAAILEHVRKDGTREVELLVNVRQAAAVALYQRLGFAIVETLTDQLLGDGKHHDEFRMTCTIT